MKKALFLLLMISTINIQDMMAQERGVGLAVVNAMPTLKTAWHDRTYKT